MEVKNGKIYKYAPATVLEDQEAHKKTVFGAKQEINAYIYPASGQVQAKQYGKELPYIMNLLTNENKLEEGYGLCVYGDDVDYVVISIKIYSAHYLCEIKKL